MEINIEIGGVCRVTYKGTHMDGSHYFVANAGRFIDISDDCLNGKSLLKAGKDFNLKRNTFSQYTVVGEA